MTQGLIITAEIVEYGDKWAVTAWNGLDGEESVRHQIRFPVGDKTKEQALELAMPALEAWVTEHDGGTSNATR